MEALYALKRPDDPSSPQVGVHGNQSVSLRDPSQVHSRECAEQTDTVVFTSSTAFKHSNHSQVLLNFFCCVQDKITYTTRKSNNKQM